MKKYSERKGASIHIEGPEKAGKTTFIKLLARAARKSGNYRKVHVVKYTKPAPDEDWSYYIDEMRDHLNKFVLKGDLVIYDRGWMSELVYGELLPGSRSINHNFEVSGHLLSRASLTNGVGLVLLGPDVKTLESNRDETDLPVDVGEERRTYKKYADYFGWNFLENTHSPEAGIALAKELLRMCEKNRNSHWKYAFSEYAGNLSRGILVVLDTPKKFADWTLISSLGEYANHIAWTNIQSINPAMLMHVHKIVAQNYSYWQKHDIASKLAKTVSIYGIPSSRDLRDMPPEASELIIERLKDYLS